MLQVRLKLSALRLKHADLKAYFACVKESLAHLQ